MRKYSLINSGSRIVLLLLFLGTAFQELYARQIEVELLPSTPRAGEAAILQVKISGASSAEPAGIPQINGLDISFSGTRRSFEFVNGRTWSGVVLNFSVLAARPGSFTIPPLNIVIDGKTEKTREFNFAVAGAVPRTGTGRGNGAVIPTVDLSSHRVYTGQPLMIRYYLIHRGIEMSGKPVFKKMPETNGFILRQVEEQIPETIIRRSGDEYTRTHIATFAALPVRDGEFRVGGGTVVLQVTDDSFFFGFPRNLKVDYESAPVRVVPLPPAGAPADYHGDVGVFTIDVDGTPGPVTVYSEKKLIIKIKGKGNLFSLSGPSVEKTDGVRMLIEKSGEHIGAGPDSPEGEVRYTATLIPEKPGTVTVKKAGFSFFNPRSGRYERVYAGPFRFEAKEGTPPPAPEKKDDTVDPDGSKHKISLLMVLFITGAVALAGGVALWERRRYRILVHGDSAQPESARASVVPERKTDYRRELYLALKRNDMPRFLRAAERSLDLIAARAGKDSAVPRNAYIAGLKRRIQLIKYAGRNFTADDADMLYKDLLKVLDEVYDGS